MAYKPSDNYALYTPRTQEFVELGRAQQMHPAREDKNRIALILVDEQVDFIKDGDGTLVVPGAMDDLKRMNEFIYANADKITSVYASLDTHLQYQIFFTSWWVYAGTVDEHPAPFTIIKLNAHKEAVDQDGRRVNPLIDPIWSLKYLQELKSKGNKDLMLWPFHCMEGSTGQTLMPSLSESLAYYSAARLSQIRFINKGRTPRTEFYSILEAEVPDPGDPTSQINVAVLDALEKHDTIYVGGQAKSHCVLETMKSLVRYFAQQPDVLQSIRFLTDCTSSVQSPYVDFDAIANAEIAKFAKLGVQLVQSADKV